MQQYDSLSHVIKFIIVFFDQSQVERGFSVNKALINDNMREKSIVARCFIKDQMQAYQLESHQVKIMKDF